MKPRFLFAFAALAGLSLSGAAFAKPKFDFVDSPLLSSAPSGSDFVEGNPDAPIVMIEYASMTCPHCAKFHTTIMPELTKRYIKTGKMAYIFRPYPLNEPALKASMLMDCVGEKQGTERYYTFTKVLFEAQNKWAFDSNWMSSLATFAKVGGVSGGMFDECTTDSAREIKLLNMKRAATKELGVDRTPTVFINGHRYDDEPTVEKITAYIDSLLAETKPSKPAAEAEKTAEKSDEKPAEKK